MRLGSHIRSSNGRRAAYVFAAAALVLAAACAKKGPPPLAEVVAFTRTPLPATAADPAWTDVPVHTASLVLQDMVEPRLLRASTTLVRVQALSDGERIAFRMSWADSSRDDLPGTGRFSDACAVQLPVAHGPDVPAPQMGERNRGVEIAYWSAAWQARVNVRPDSIQALYPNAHVDHYPFEAAPLARGTPEAAAMARRYAPARAVNRIDHPPGRPVQDLLAEGPGTITPAAETVSDGNGDWKLRQWNVVITRPVPADVRASKRTQVAFAIWNGSRQEVGARKMRTLWIPLSLGGVP
jgi:hypothetical protein